MSGRASSTAVTLPPARSGLRAPVLVPGRSPSLTQLAVQQGVSPVEDLDALGDLWPCDDDPEELLQHVLAERAARRRLARAEG